MTTAIEVPTAGGVQLARIFNARGAALLAMLAKTDKAADFRAWVLDVLEGEQNKLPSQRMDLLQKELLAAKPKWKKILYYKEKGLRNFEIAKLLECHRTTIGKELRIMEACGLIEPPVNLAKLQQLALPLLCATPVKEKSIENSRNFPLGQRKALRGVGAEPHLTNKEA